MISIEKPGTPEELVHYGVKGMKWGVRREHQSAGKTRTRAEIEKSERRKRNAKKAAIATGVLVIAAGAAYVAYKSSQSGNIPVSSLKSSSGEAAVKKILDDPGGIIYSSRGKTKGYRIYTRGGLKDPEEFFIRNNITDMANGSFKKLDNGSIAARILDPLGRKDQAGRPIGHDIIVPKIMAFGIDNVEDVEKKIWPLVKDVYDPE